MVFLNSSLYLVGLFLLDMCAFPFCFFLVSYSNTLVHFFSIHPVKTQLGEITIDVPRDRNGEYEPSIINKYSRNADGMEEKILSLYSCGMSQRDISEQIKTSMMLKYHPSLSVKSVKK